MRKSIFTFILLCLGTYIKAQGFNAHFCDSTLRLNYIFAGDASNYNIFVDELNLEPRWYGRRKHLNELPLKGNGQITVTDYMTNEIIYKHSFSTLFQEWIATAEAKHTGKSFENVFLVPFPKNKIRVKVELYDYHNRIVAQATHIVNPQDILIRRIGFRNVTPYTTIHAAGDTTNCINIAYVAEGYTMEQMDDYINDAKTATDALFSHEPFKSMRDKFNIVAVRSVSEDSGTSEPANNIWRKTALDSHFDTFYSDRYLTTLHLKKLHDLLAGVPYEHIIILVNTDKYGGGGIYNSYNLSYTKGKYFKPVVVHEFGHSFGGLGDEYDYGNDDPMYFSDTEPWEPNLTTKHDFRDKWENLVEEGKAGFVEGGGYQSKGVFRGVENCRMKTNDVPEFCVVCRQALTRLIRFYTE
ncbi:M64 family metallopeptidase [Xylanibacter muris]|uniref:Peptidase M64 n=1 Tax=Xylanibacter muris TaxID=2736290 RepID=A0ABX2APT7_9BACT|nr:M64 family metallopeptidase [Xylanibacter muris]NPD93140.1 peptidase M64 [Xylanibacter muris]